MQDAFARIVEQRLQHIAPILPDVVLVGGAAVGIVLSDPGAAPARPTDDVDLVVAVDTRIEYEHIADRLRTLGLSEDSASKVICRWHHSASGTIYDVMPTDGAALGFTNEWYAPAFDTAPPLALPGGLIVRCATVPYLLAMKLVAFDDRGERDFLASHDMNDFVAMIDGVPDIVECVRDTDERLQAWLASRIAEALAAEHHHDMLLGYLMPDEASQQRRSLIEDRLRLLARS
jgi:predicted nucleotidyltransferase